MTHLVHSIRHTRIIKSIKDRKYDKNKQIYIIFLKQLLILVDIFLNKFTLRVKFFSNQHLKYINTLTNLYFLN